MAPNRYEAATTMGHRLAGGKVYEGKVALWLIAHGYIVVPVYEMAEGQGKGPQIFSKLGGLIAPDIIAIYNSPKHPATVRFIEIKSKTASTWHRKTEKWCTGNTQRHVDDYRKVAERTGLPVWILFHHLSEQPSPEDLEHGCPALCPNGLFAQEVNWLADNIHHPHDGMLYWDVARLRKLAPVQEIQ